MNTTLLFFITGLMTALIPGPDLTFITRSTLAGGIKKGLVASTGILTGLLVYLTISASGISFIGKNFYFQLITGSFGVIYLLTIAKELWNETTESLKCHSESKKSFLRTYINALLIHFSNPKAIIFFGVLLTPFLNDNNVFIHCTSLYSGFIISFYSYTYGISRIEKKIKPHIMTRINKAISIFFVIFSLKLLHSTIILISTQK